MKIVPYTDIEFSFDTRGRREYNNIESLGADILKRGLINPITVHSTTGEAPYTLICGGRRYLALEHIGAKEVSVRVYTRPLTLNERTAIELMENIQREDLTEMEKVIMTKRIDETLKSIHGRKLGGSKNAPGHSMRDTAKMLGRSQASVQQDIALANAVEQYPELELDKAPNKFVARKVVERLKVFTKARLQELCANDIVASGDYIVGDFFENELEAHSFDFIDCDPPYGIDLFANKDVAQKGVLHGYKEVPKLEYIDFVHDTVKECTHLAKDDAYMVFWYANEWYPVIMTSLSLNGWVVSYNPGIWVKGNNTLGLGQTRWPEYELANSYETFLIARRGMAQLRKKARSNVFNYDGVPGAHKIHPAEKPAALMKELLLTFCWPGARILAPFAGSGRTLKEATKLGFSSVGFDIFQENKDKYNGHN